MIVNNEQAGSGGDPPSKSRLMALSQFSTFSDSAPPAVFLSKTHNVLLWKVFQNPREVVGAVIKKFCTTTRFIPPSNASRIGSLDALYDANATGSISAASLLRTLPTRISTG